MKLLIVSTSPLIKMDNGYASYSPYAKELHIWAQYADEIAFSAPIWKEDRGLLISKINFPIHTIFEVKEFDITSLKNGLKAFAYSFFNIYLLFKAMIWADHIHLRCPGNISLFACVIQIFFPGKSKTVKYAGNWDPKSPQPLSYRMQKWIVSNTLLTKNMQVLVYGEWENSSKNIKPFFTASYFEKDKTPVNLRELNGIISFLFVGTLSNGKQPLYAIKLVEQLHKTGRNVTLTLLGEGNERAMLESYITENNLASFVFLKGNQNQEFVKNAYSENHFLILPSLSEGWPKVVAEAMFWGCLPLVSPVSCVPNMLDQGNRGILLAMKLSKDIEQLTELLQDNAMYQHKVNNAVNWSRNYTLDLFEQEIKMLLQS